MKGRKWQFLLCFIGLLYTYKPGMAKTITIATGNFPPLYHSTSPDSEKNGLVLDLVKEAFAAVGIQVRYYFVPWGRANYHARSGLADASCCWFDQKERAEHALYSEPVYRYTYSFFHLKTTQFDWQNIEDLSGYKIGGTLSYTYTRDFTDAEKAGNIEVVRVSSDLKNIKKLLAGRIDVFPLNTEVGYYLLKTELKPEDAERFTHHSKPLIDDYVHLLFPKSLASSDLLREQFNLGLKKIKSN